MYRIYNLWKGSCNRQFIRVNHEEIRSCWKLLSYLMISYVIFPVFLKMKSRCNFVDSWVMRHFLEDFAFLLKRVQLALRYAIQFLVTFSKYSTRFTVLLDISPFFRILVTQTTIIVTFVMTQHFENIAKKSGNFLGQVPFKIDS